MILHLAISVEHRVVTNRQTCDYGTYRRIMVSHGNKINKSLLLL